MWEKSKNVWLIILLTLSLSAPAYFSSSAAGGSIPKTEPQTTITMSLTQYNQLKEIIERQDSRLTQLQIKLTQLKNNSVSASSELAESQNELNKLKEELMTTQESLESAKISLTQAEEKLKKQEESLQTLTKQIKELEHKQTVIRRQRDVWAGLFGTALVSLLIK